MHSHRCDNSHLPLILFPVRDRMDRYRRLAQIAGIVPVGVTATTVMSPSQAGHNLRTHQRECRARLASATTISFVVLLYHIMALPVKWFQPRSRDMRSGDCAKSSGRGPAPQHGRACFDSMFHSPTFCMSGGERMPTR